MDKREINVKYAEIGNDLIQTEESLKSIRDSNVEIIYLASKHKKVSSGQMVFGQCEKIADKYKWGIPCDFTITVFEPCVQQCEFDEGQIRALIHHELLHVGIEREETLIGAEEKYYIVPHDIDDFRLILERYGVNWNCPKLR